MANFTYKFYKNIQDFGKGIKFCECELISSIDELEKAAISIGTFKNYSPKEKGLDFYRSIPNIALTDSNGAWKMNDNYKNAEQSIKTSISFMLGMIMTKIIASEKHGLLEIFHFKDSISVVPYPNGRGDKTPDFFGIDSNWKKAYLFEAKGTTGKKYKKDIQKAQSQFNGISTITFTSRGGRSKIFKSNEIKKHVIAAQFVNDRLVCLDIDPEPMVDVEIDLDLAVAESYAGLVTILKEFSNVKEEERILFKNEDFEIGMNEQIFERIGPIVEMINSAKKELIDKQKIILKSNYEIESEIEEMKKDIIRDQKARDEEIELSQESEEEKIEQKEIEHEKITRKLELLSGMEESNKKLKGKEGEENELKEIEENLINGIKEYHISKEKRELATELIRYSEDRMSGLFSLVSEKNETEKIFFINKSNR